MMDAAFEVPALNPVSGMEALVGTINRSFSSVQENRIDVTITDTTGGNIDRLYSYDMSTYSNLSGDRFFANSYHDTIFDRNHNISISISEHTGNMQSEDVGVTPRRTHPYRIERLR